MNIDIKDVHVGQAIDQRRNELGLSKSELGRRLGIPQQHINRLLERETMETKRLVKACKALDFNFSPCSARSTHRYPHTSRQWHWTGEMPITTLAIVVLQPSLPLNRPRWKT